MGSSPNIQMLHERSIFRSKRAGSADFAATKASRIAALLRSHSCGPAGPPP